MVYKYVNDYSLNVIIVEKICILKQMEQSPVWMYQRLDSDRYLSKIFIERVDEFIDFATAQELFRNMNKIKCLCIKCWNGPYLDVDTVKLHLYKQGFRTNYYKWVCHGETFEGV